MTLKYTFCLVTLFYFANARYVDDTQYSEEEINYLIQDSVECFTTRLAPLLSRMSEQQKHEISNFALPALVSYIQNMVRYANYNQKDDDEEEYSNDEARYAYGEEDSFDDDCVEKDVDFMEDDRDSFGIGKVELFKSEDVFEMLKYTDFSDFFGTNDDDDDVYYPEGNDGTYGGPNTDDLDDEDRFDYGDAMILRYNIDNSDIDSDETEDSNPNTDENTDPTQKETKISPKNDVSKIKPADETVESKSDAASEAKSSRKK